MNQEFISEATTTINASTSRVWEALTNPGLLKQFLYGTEVTSDWKVGSPITYRGEWQGKAYEDKGEIVRIEPPALLVHTHWSPLSGLPDEPDNYQEVTWALEERNGRTELTIAERNLPSEQAKATSEDGWRTALDALKSLLEK